MGAVNSIVDIVNGVTRLAMALIPLAIVLGVLLGANIPIFGGGIEEIVRIVKIFVLIVWYKWYFLFTKKI